MLFITVFLLYFVCGSSYSYRRPRVLTTSRVGYLLTASGYDEDSSAMTRHKFSIERNPSVSGTTQLFAGTVSANGDQGGDVSLTKKIQQFVSRMFQSVKSFFMSVFTAIGDFFYGIYKSVRSIFVKDDDEKDDIVATTNFIEVSSSNKKRQTVAEPVEEDLQIDEPTPSPPSGNKEITSSDRQYVADKLKEFEKVKSEKSRADRALPSVNTPSQPVSKISLSSSGSAKQVDSFASSSAQATKGTVESVKTDVAKTLNTTATTAAAPTINIPKPLQSNSSSSLPKPSSDTSTAATVLVKEVADKAKAATSEVASNISSNSSSTGAKAVAVVNSIPERLSKAGASASSISSNVTDNAKNVVSKVEAAVEKTFNATVASIPKDALPSNSSVSNIVNKANQTVAVTANSASKLSDQAKTVVNDTKTISDAVLNKSAVAVSTNSSLTSRVDRSAFLGTWLLKEFRKNSTDSATMGALPMDDKIIIPEYGNVMSTVPGSSGVSFDLKESPTSQQLVRLKVLRGCSGTQWVKDESGAQSVEIIRPPKSPWDQLPTVCLYEGVFENGIVKGKVYKIQNSAAVPNVIGNDGEGTSVMQYQDFENNEDIATEDNLIGTFEMSRMPK